MDGTGSSTGRVALATGGLGRVHAGSSVGGAELPSMTAPDEEIR
jgi:hypothetical protein